MQHRIWRMPAAWQTLDSRRQMAPLFHFHSKKLRLRLVGKARTPIAWSVRRISFGSQRLAALPTIATLFQGWHWEAWLAFLPWHYLALSIWPQEINWSSLHTASKMASYIYNREYINESFWMLSFQTSSGFSGIGGAATQPLQTWAWLHWDRRL